MRSIKLYVALFFLLLPQIVQAQRLEDVLKQNDRTALAQEAREHGNARQGAVLFYQQSTACRKCHLPTPDADALGPNLSKWDKKPTDEELIEAILYPSKTIRKGFEPITIIEDSGKIRNGLLVKGTEKEIVYRSLETGNQSQTLSRDAVEEIFRGKQSLMPEGLVNLLANRGQFLDLLKYLMEIRDGGEQTDRLLKPPRHLYATPPLPAYEANIDHEGFLAEFDRESFQRGAAIYNRVCMNCHGTKDKPGSLPTSLKFASGRFRNGADPFTMYQTVTRGFGMMPPQYQLVPQQKYDVIHYIREAYLKPHNPSQYVPITPEYLRGLSKGSERGPEPLDTAPWIAMNYGDSLINTYEIGQDSGNFSYKGIAVRVDPGPGGVSQGNNWMVFDHDTLRLAGAWSGQGFIDWNGIHFNGKHGVHPTTSGNIEFMNPVGPGWAHPDTGSWEDPRFRGRDDKPYGPLPREWAHYRGLYRHGNRRVISYTVGTTPVLESPALIPAGQDNLFARQLVIGPHDSSYSMAVATLPEDSRYAIETDNNNNRGQTLFAARTERPASNQNLKFRGDSFAQIPGKHQFDLTNQDFSIAARLKTKQGGTIFSQTLNGPKWAPDCKALFIRGGRLCYDIGWVGVVQSKQKIDDGQWHDVVMSWDHENGRVRLFIDGELDQTGTIKPKAQLKKSVVRLGFASPNFPAESYFRGNLQSIQFFNVSKTPQELKTTKAVASWNLKSTQKNWVKDQSGEADARVVNRTGKQTASPKSILVGVTPGTYRLHQKENRIVLEIPPSQKEQHLTVWVTSGSSGKNLNSLTSNAANAIQDLPNLTDLLSGGPADWPEKIRTERIMGENDTAFAVDQFSLPTDNPWNAQVRATGLDFYPDEDAAAVCMWDGDVWKVTGLHSDDGRLTWQRIGSGLFQPLGLKIVDGKVFVSCRDQLLNLHDLNGDGETDYYENFNNDHQVTEHFHEFAMGLQTDDAGNFYYAKSARHAKTALVPHHGTLLRVSPDGEYTTILATGFRAANGVCLNPDGTFIVTDQEGHWNPKNRINWVREGGFYGNMYGYHDVTDSSDEAMEQPLCWITNAFDRSPAELLWVPEDAWGDLGGSLLNLSYGYGKVFLVPHEEIDGQMQGGMIELPLPQFPTGLMRGRFHPEDRQLYVCGMVAWGSNQRTPGGFYRIRKTDQPAYLPLALHAEKQTIKIVFSDPVDDSTATDPKNYSILAWDLKRSANYGSKHYNERTWNIDQAELSADGKTVTLTIPEMTPTWGMEIKYFLSTPDGKPLEGTIHNTIHTLP
ncbi:MAG: c-type cytochrome [Planctomycetaceae bacterium]|nr:c-type cytochrome [Planctomycetaceae bacterium]